MQSLRSLFALCALSMLGCGVEFVPTTVACSEDFHCPSDHFCNSLSGAAGVCRAGERPPGQDSDGDGVSLEGGDCDDTDPDNYPGNTEVCDGRDNDCDGTPDFDEQGEVDGDADGSISCADCDDADSSVTPGADELCDGRDNDCDGEPSPAELLDADGDGVMACADCDDDDASSAPGAAEHCDGADNDCDGEVPADEQDSDADGVTPCAGDCGPQDATVYPGAPESCDAVDSDCDDDLVDGDVDTDLDGEPDCTDPDDDGDTFPDGVDCEPTDPSAFPNGTEVCDAVDNDCDGDLVEGFANLDGDTLPDCADDDADGDGASAALDCDDLDATSTTVATDGDCDGAETAVDCDDSDPTSTTLATDGDCDGVLTADDCDDGDPASTVVATDADCDGLLAADDCDDNDAWSTAVADDLDCDGAITALDCDDADPTSTVLAEDPECDGIVNCLDTTDAQGITFVRLCDGTFEMGCTAAQVADGNCDGSEMPAHTVTLTRPFWISETEITQAQWSGLMGTNPGYWGPGTAWSCGLDCPVESVNWYEAVAFANALSVAEGFPACYGLTGCSGVLGAGCTSGSSCNTGTYVCTSVSILSASGSPYDCDGYRLPTEAEWEYAARAGTDLIYAGSDTVGDVGLYLGNVVQGPAPVADFAPNAWGLFDMSGNVKEWVNDSHHSSYYSVSPQVDPEGPVFYSLREVRSGDHNDAAQQVRVSSRNGQAPERRAGDLGIRLVRSIP